MMSPEEIQQMSQAISTAVVQALMKALSETPAEDPADPEGDGIPGNTAAPPPPAGPPAAPPKPPGPGDQNSAEEIDEADDGEDVDGIDKKSEEKMNTKMAKKLDELELEVAKYRRDAGEVSNLRKEVNQIRAEKVKAERHSRLATLQSEGYRFRDEIKDGKVTKAGLDREVERCATMTDDQFQAHCVGIVENYSKIDPPRPHLRTFPIDGQAGAAAVEDEAKAQDAAVEARNRVAKYRKEGKRDVAYPAVLNEVRKERGLSAIA